MKRILLGVALALTMTAAAHAEDVRSADPAAAPSAPPLDEKNVPEPQEALPLPEAPESAELAALIDGVAGFYDKVEHIRMSFTQVVQRKTRRKTKKASGSIEFSRPGKMRWEYKKPDRVTYVADGKTLWAWQPEDNLVYRSKIEGSRLYHALRFLFGIGDLRTAFRAQSGPAHGPDTAFLILTPRSGKQDYKELSLVVDRKTYEIRESFLTDPMDNVTHYIFGDHDYETPIPAGRFQFTPPPGATVQDI